eukprot:6180958-Pleurochrysis_carterae.AAC.3
MPYVRSFQQTRQFDCDVVRPTPSCGQRRTNGRNQSFGAHLYGDESIGVEIEAGVSQPLRRAGLGAPHHLAARNTKTHTSKLRSIGCLLLAKMNCGNGEERAFAPRGCRRGLQGSTGVRECAKTGGAVFLPGSGMSADT